jgi:hypothetical protein
MKILFVAHRTPFPPNKGEKIRAYHFLAELAKRHMVSLLYWLDDATDVKHVDALRKICQGPVVPIRLNVSASIVRGLLSLLRGRSFSEGYFHCRQFQSAFNELVQNQQPDVVFVFSSAMGGYLHGLGQIPAIVDFVDVDSEKWGQLA